MKKILGKHRNELEQVAEEFKASGIQRISLAIDDDICVSVNLWFHCPGDKTWKRSDNLKNKELASLDEVLKKENISKDTYNKFSSALKKIELEEISDGFMPDCNCIEFQIGTAGLRYYNNNFKNTKFHQDREYLKVNKIDNNWYSFERDWN